MRGLTAMAGEALHGAMWIGVLRAVLFGMLALLLVSAAFFAGAAMGKKSAASRYKPGPVEVTAENRELARGFAEAALAARFAGREREALRYFEEARRHDPGLRGLDYQRALTLLALGEFDEAESATRRSLDNGEEIANAHAMLGLVTLERARAKGTVEQSGDAIRAQVEEARLADPLNPMPFYVLAEYLRAAGQPDAAVDAYQKALERVSKSDSILISTVKAGLAGMRLNFSASSPRYRLQEVNGAAPPEQLYFAAADALLRGDQEGATGYLERVREQVPSEVFKTLLQDSFFQDYLAGAMVSDPKVKALQK